MERKKVIRQRSLRLLKSCKENKNSNACLVENHRSCCRINSPRNMPRTVFPVLSFYRVVSYYRCITATNTIFLSVFKKKLESKNVVKRFVIIFARFYTKEVNTMFNFDFTTDSFKNVPCFGNAS